MRPIYRVLIFLFCGLGLPLLPAIHAQTATLNYAASSGDSIRVLGVTPNADGGLYVLAEIANTTSNADQSNWSDPVVLKLANDGSLIWDQRYDAGTFQPITKIVPTSDGGFALGGTSTTDYFNMYAGKADADGNIQWSFFLGDDYDLERGYGLAATSDGGYIVTGHSSDFIEQRLFVTKLSANGSLEWGRVYAEAGLEQTGYDVQEMPNGDFLIVGENGEFFESNFGMVARISASGDLLWAKNYDYLDNGNTANRVELLNDGTFVLLQPTVLLDAGSPFSGDNAAILSRMDGDGNEIWSRLLMLDDGNITVMYNGINLSFGASPSGLAITPEGDILLSTTADFDQSDDLRPNLLKINADGELIWSRELAEPGFAQLTSFARTSSVAVAPNGQYAYTYQDINERDNFFISLLNPDGSGTCADDTAPELIPINLDITDANLQTIVLDAQYPSITITAPQGFDITEVATGDFELDLGEDQILCSDSLVLSTGLGDTATYLWQDGSTDSTFTATTSGVYAVTVTQDECVASDSVTVTTLDNAVDLGPDQTLCTESTLSLMPTSILEGDYSWNTGEETSTIEVEDVGTYILSLETVCGIVADTLEVVAAAPPTLSTDGPDLACLTDSVTLTASTDPGLTIDWSDLEGQPLTTGDEFNFLLTGDTVIIVQASDGCGIATDTLEVTASLPPSLLGELTFTGCNEDNGAISLSIFGGVAPYSTEWLDPDGNTINQGDTIITDLAAGEYFVIVEDALGCVRASPFNIGSVDPPVATTEILSPSCFGFTDGQISVSLTDGTEPFTYDWSQDGQPLPDTDSELTGLPAGAYGLTVTDASDCTLVLDDLNLTAPDSIVLDVAITSVDCPEQATGAISVAGIMGGTFPFLYQLDDGGFQEEPSFANLEPGTYTLTTQDAQGCEVSLDAVVEAPTGLTLTLTAEPNPAQLGDIVRLQALISPIDSSNLLSWQNSSDLTVLSCDNCPDPSVLAIESATLTVTLLTEGGCVLADSLLLVVSDERPVYIPNVFSPNEDGRNDQFEVYPGKGAVGLVGMDIYDRWGGLVYQSTNGNAAWDGTVQGTRAKPAVYTYVVTVQWLDGRVTRHEGDVTLVR